MTTSRLYSAARFGAILALATAAVAQDFTLNSFDPLNSNNIPAACKRAYTAPLEGCRRSDFTTDKTCSAACVRSVDQMQENIQLNCGGLLLPVDTLLAQALLGNLRKLLCPGAQDPPSEESTTTIPPRSTRAPTTIVVSVTSATPSPELSTIQPETPTTVAFTTTLRSSSLTVPVIATPDPVPAPTDIAVPANPPSSNPPANPPSGQNTDDNQGARSPGGNDILNPVFSASSTVLPRLDLLIAAAIVSYVIW